MKKVFITLFSSVILVVFLSRCKKDSDKIEVKPEAELSVLKEQTLFQVLTAAKQVDFRKLVLQECLKQKHGDYNVYLKDVALILKGKKEYEEIVSSLDILIPKIRELNGGREPLIFYPRAEVIAENEKNKVISRIVNGEVREPIGVYEGVYELDYSSPGYIIDNGFSLVYYQNITEDYAWENDVWVLGQEENVSDENMVPAIEDQIGGRFQGQSEYGGIIQCTNLNAIEHWTAGKLEFKIFVFDANGVKRSERAFGRWKRSNFKDQKWKDFGHFIANWNTSVFGNWMSENWWEEDGGQSNSVTITMPPPSGQTGPTVSTTIPSKNLDDNLGVATIQFTDPISQIYNISFANIKRRN
jgi:hypothetical protein